MPRPKKKTTRKKTPAKPRVEKQVKPDEPQIKDEAELSELGLKVDKPGKDVVSSPGEPPVIKPMTKAEALERLRSNPQAIRFYDTRYKGHSIADGEFYIRFANGEYITDNVAEVAVIIRAPGWNLHIFCDEYWLRKAV